jgi:hypothetical protein
MMHQPGSALLHASSTTSRQEPAGHQPERLWLILCAQVLRTAEQIMEPLVLLCSGWSACMLGLCACVPGSSMKGHLCQ